MAEKSEKFFSKTNHALSFFLGIIFTIGGLVIVGLLALYFLQINPDDYLLQLAQSSNSTLDNTQQSLRQGIDLTALNFSSADHSLGSAEADYVLVVYGDLTCPHSQQFYRQLVSFAEANSSQVQIIWRHFPLTFHPAAASAALASECAASQNKFWDFLDLIYAQSADYSDLYYQQLASQLGLDLAQFNDCYQQAQYQELVNAQVAEGIAVGITGTPNILLLNKKDDTFQYIGGAVNQDYLESLLQ